MKTPLGIGVVGCGRWGPNHIRTFHSVAGCEVRWAADLSEERRLAVQRQFPGVRMTSNVSELVEAEDVDAVVIATPTCSHHALGKQALAAGKHVLCEKPLTVEVDESLELLDLAKTNGLTLMVGHIFMYNPGVIYLKRKIDEGVLGRVFYMDAVRTNLGPIRQDVGAVYDLASHDVSIFNFLLGAEPCQVSAVGGSYIQRDHEDMAFLTLGYPSGAMCHVHVSWLNPRKVRQLTVVGNKKMAVWDDMQPLESIRLYDKGLEERPSYDTFGQFQMILRDADITIPRIEMFEPMRRQAEHFVDCIRDGRQPLSDGRNGLSVVRALNAALESMQHQGRPVSIESVELEIQQTV